MRLPYKFKSGCLRIRTNKLDYSSVPTEEYEWSRTWYRGAKEEIPHNVPTPKGKRVILTSYVDVNLLHCVVTGEAVTASLHMVNQTVISWSSQKQKTIETATYGLEFVAAWKTIQQNIRLQLTLRYLGVPIEGPTFLFENSKSVVKSSTIPDSRLGQQLLEYLSVIPLGMYGNFMWKLPDLREKYMFTHLMENDVSRNGYLLTKTQIWAQKGTKNGAQFDQYL
jgi:hypothetical protein